MDCTADCESGSADYCAAEKCAVPTAPLQFGHGLHTLMTGLLLVLTAAMTVIG